MVFPDTSPRGVDENCPEAGSADWTVGYGAGHYCNATQAPWNKHFNMYTYVTEELPSIVERNFNIAQDRRSVMGFSMGGGGALICAAKRPDLYVSATALSPISYGTHSEFFTMKAFAKYFGSAEGGADYSAVDVLNAKGTGLTLPPGFVDVASSDQFEDALNWPDLISALNTNGHNWPVNYNEGYNHSYYFVNDMFEHHIDFHAGHLLRR